MATYKELRDFVYKNTLMNPAYHAEQLLKVENIRPVETQAAWDQLIADAILAGDQFFYGSISEEQEIDGELDGGQSYDRTENILVQCLKDPTAQDKDNNLIGGIDQPNLQLGIVRMEADRDPLGQVYMFQRMMEDNSETLWRLHFARHIHAIQGLEQ